MLVQIPEVLSAEQVADARHRLATAAWVDGKVTAGPQSARAKDNRQVADGDPAARVIGEAIVLALQRHPLFISAALPRQVFPPLFNSYAGGQSFGSHVDNAIRQLPGSAHRLRTDLSCTLFLTSPDDYDGGELVIEDTFGAHAVKLPAGDLVLYPSTSVHHVRPVTRGTRVSAFFWVQSLVRHDADRALLFELDTAIRRLPPTPDTQPSAVQLTGIYHNLIRRWAEL